MVGVYVDLRAFFPVCPIAQGWIMLTIPIRFSLAYKEEPTNDVQDSLY